MAEKQRYIIEAVDRFSENFKKIDKKLDSLSKNFHSTGRSSKNTSQRIIRHFKNVDGKLIKTVTRVKKVDGSIRETVQNLQKAKIPNIGRKMGLSSFFLGNLRTFVGLIGVYSSFSFAKSIMDAQTEMENINATLSAVTKKFRGSTSATRAVREEMDFLRKTSDELGVSLPHMIKPYAKFMAASRFNLSTTRETFKSFAKLGRVFGLAPAELGGIIKALEQMQSKGKVMAEELRLQLGDRMPGALKLFSDAAGISTEEFIKLMEQGRISANIIKLVGKQIELQYGEAAKTALRSQGAELARLSNKWFGFRTLLAEKSKGMFKGIIKGLSSMIDAFTRALSSKSFVALSEALGKLKNDLAVLEIPLKIFGATVKGMFKFIITGVTGVIEGISKAISLFKELANLRGRDNKLASPGNFPKMSLTPELKQDVLGKLGISPQTQILQKENIEVNVNFDNLPPQANISTNKSSGVNLNVGSNFALAY